MKKVLLAITLTAVTLGVIAPAYADDHHHHPVCHKVKVHGHWQKRCHYGAGVVGTHCRCKQPR